MNPEQEQEILALREKKLTPKQIARKMGLKVSEVTAFVKEKAEEAAIARSESGGLAPVAQCFVNADCVDALFSNDRSIGEEDLEEDSEAGGIAMVTIARSEGYNRYTVCSYLVDYWCLGVKDTLGPRKLNQSDFKQFISFSYAQFPEDAVEISLEQAQAIVFSAVEFAENLGFKPHHDFEETKAHLGEWNGEPKIECGRNGKPFYISGPFDNPEHILHKLQKNAGEGNYHYAVGVDHLM